MLAAVAEVLPPGKGALTRHIAKTCQTHLVSG